MNWFILMMVAGTCLCIGAAIWFLACCIISSERISQAKNDLAQAQDYIKLLRGQMEQN